MTLQHVFRTAAAVLDAQAAPCQHSAGH